MFCFSHRLFLNSMGILDFEESATLEVVSNEDTRDSMLDIRLKKSLKSNFKIKYDKSNIWFLESSI